MVQTELNAAGQKIGNRLAILGCETFVDDIAAKREGQTIIFTPPPNTQIFAQLQSLVLIRQLTLMNDQSHIRIATIDRVENLIKRNHLVFKL